MNTLTSLLSAHFSATSSPTNHDDEASTSNTKTQQQTYNKLAAAVTPSNNPNKLRTRFLKKN